METLPEKMAIVSGTSFSQLETRLAHVFTLDSPFIVTYQDEAGHTVVIETTEELGFFISDGTGPCQLDVSVIDDSKENRAQLALKSHEEETFRLI
ncbi:hypothetical protein DSO57_1007400 [Entomophthora muscae]|uniref:Uncharacterized protein n=1 Tax=Entomophthora muscae TaxID=34485 RepID=A0ACC2TV24_9FUNG|nr:hypothetical protein DSO57_1007400 [Entomophthora muscae]